MGPQINCEKKLAMPLHRQAEEQIRRTGYLLNFPKELESRYQHDVAPSRQHELRLVARIGLAMFLTIGVLMNLFIDPHPQWKLCLLYAGLLTGVMLLVQPCFRPAASFLKREGAIFGFYTICCLATVALLFPQHHGDVFEPFILAALPISFLLILVRMPFPFATALAAVAGGAYCFAVLAQPELSGSHKAFLIGFLLALVVPTLIVARRLERASRRLYLHKLLQRLNYERVLEHDAVVFDVSYTDPLTGIANRRRMDVELQRLCDKEDTCSTLLVADIDWFKNFNDRYGYQVGDRLLKEVATCLTAALRGNDLLARLGGEEFGVLLPDMPMQEAVLVAERLRTAVLNYPFMVGTRIVRISISIGVASIVGYDEPARVLDAAEKGLFRAKRAGRNRVGGPWLKVAS